MIATGPFPELLRNSVAVTATAFLLFSPLCGFCFYPLPLWSPQVRPCYWRSKRRPSRHPRNNRQCSKGSRHNLRQLPFRPDLLSCSTLHMAALTPVRGDRAGLWRKISCCNLPERCAPDSNVRAIALS